MPQTLAGAFVSIRRELPGVAGFMGAIWLCFFLQEPLSLIDYGLVPRSSAGLPGIVAMPFLHGDLQHLLSNSSPLAILLVLLAGSRARTWLIVGAILILSGVTLWACGASNTRYVGASMLVFGLIAFLIVSGLRERRMIPMLIAVVVGVLYGWTAVVGLMPLSREISEFSHLIGAGVGVGLAFWMTPSGTAEARHGNSPDRRESPSFRK